MTERLFFALWPGERQRTLLTRIQEGLPIRQGRKAHPDDLHTTLVFLGDLDAERRACIEGAADRVEAAGFAFFLDHIGSFPRARVVWCGAADSPAPLLDLLRALGDRLSECGFRSERRVFKPHVTLVRKARPIPARELEDKVFWPVSEFSLVVARPGQRPRYRVVRTWPLIS